MKKFEINSFDNRLHFLDRLVQVSDSSSKQHRFLHMPQFCGTFTFQQAAENFAIKLQHTSSSFCQAVK